MLLKDPASWNKLCSSLDVIGDTEWAFEAYAKMPEPKSVGENYILLYGILQVMFVQQDAVAHLAESLDIPYCADPVITSIREVRNSSIGHPTKRGRGKGTAFNFISQISMHKSGFTLLTTYATHDTTFQHVDIPPLIESQRNLLKTALNDVLEKLKEEEMKHKEEFKSKKLADVFPPTLGYFFEKIGEAIHGNKPSEFGAIHVDLVVKLIESFKAALEERGLLGAHDSIDYDLNLIEYPLEELRQFFINPEASKLNARDADIFKYFLKKHIDGLIRFAEEIDEDYANGE